MYRKRLVIGLITLQIVFGIIFTLAFVNFVRCRSMLGIGLPPEIETSIIMGFSILSMFNVVYELGRV